jgi:hypothetical protein
LIFVLFIITAVLPCGQLRADEGLRSGSRYVIVGPVFLRGAYENLNDRRGNKDVARAYVVSGQIAKRAWLAFQCQIPVGTVMTILGPPPNAWNLPFAPDRYCVRLTPDISRGLDVQITLHIGLDGSLDGLNPALFARHPSDGTLPLSAVPLTIAPCSPAIDAPLPGTGEGN